MTVTDVQETCTSFLYVCHRHKSHTSVHTDDADDSRNVCVSVSTNRRHKWNRVVDRSRNLYTFIMITTRTTASTYGAHSFSISSRHDCCCSITGENATDTWRVIAELHNPVMRDHRAVSACGVTVITRYNVRQRPLTNDQHVTELLPFKPRLLAVCMLSTLCYEPYNLNLPTLTILQTLLTSQHRRLGWRTVT